jgi:hypothetical protein
MESPLVDAIAPETKHTTEDPAPSGALAGELQRLPTRIGPSRWAGWEHAYGYGV